MIYFAGRELAQKLSYLKSQSKELNLSINYPKFVEPLVKFYISLFGIPEIGLQERFNFLENCMNKVSGKVIVDAGCGSGINVRYVANKFPRSKIYAFDIENKLIKLNRKITKQKNIVFINHDLTKPLSQLKNKVDVLYCIDVLEHIKNYQQVLKVFNTWIKKNGYLIIHVPLPHQKRWFNFFKTWSHKTHHHEGIKEKKLIKLLKDYQIILRQPTFGAIGSLIWEINTLLFKSSSLVAAIFYPFLRLLLFTDRYIFSKKYNCIGIVLKKNGKN